MLTTTNPFAHLIGQERAIALLEGAITTNRIAPAYLFTGASGVGRSLAARAFIERLFCQGVPPKKYATIRKRLQQGNHPDLLWVEPTYLHNGKRLSVKEANQQGIKRKSSPQIRLDQIREITQFLARSPLSAPRQVVVLEHAQTMAEGAANGLLKTLEEPGEATLILIAPSPESLLPTLVSRCQRIPFYCLSQRDMEVVLRETEHGEILHDSSILAVAQGSPGQAIAAFEQLQAIPRELLSQLTQLPKTYRHALELAKEIDRSLEVPVQLWLVDYLQHSYWQSYRSPNLIQQLEQARQYLQKLVQPRLVWEVVLGELALS